jgi:hypothetical protein
MEHQRTGSAVISVFAYFIRTPNTGPCILTHLSLKQNLSTVLLVLTFFKQQRPLGSTGADQLTLDWAGLGLWLQLLTAELTAREDRWR